MKINPVWYAVSVIVGAAFLLLCLVNMDWDARNLLAEFGWELSAQLAYAASMFVPLAIGIIVGNKIKSSAWAWGVGIALFFSTAALGFVLIEEAPHQIKWRVEAMRDGSRR